MFICPSCGSEHKYKTFVGKDQYSCCGQKLIERPRKRISAEEVHVARTLEFFGDLMLNDPLKIFSSYELTVLALISKAGPEERDKLRKVYPVHCQLYLEWAQDREFFLRRYGFGKDYIVRHDYIVCNEV